MTNTRMAKNNLKGEVATEKKQVTIADLIRKSQGQFEAALPKHMTGEKFVRVALTQIRLNPILQDCTVQSLLGGLMTAASLGLEPGMMGQCYLIPFKNRKAGTTEAQFQVGYKGLIELSRRSGVIQTIVAHEVRANDDFKFEYGYEEKLIHKPVMFGDRGEVIGYYAYAIMKDGGKACQVMSVEDIKRHAMQYSQAYANGYTSPWKTDFNAMAKKTVIKQLLKFLPVSIELLEKVSQDEKIKTAETEEDFKNILETGHEAEVEPVLLAKEETKKTLLEQCITIGWDIRKKSVELIMEDFDTLTEDGAERLQSFIDEEVNKKL